MLSGKKKGLCSNVVVSRSDRVVVKHGWCYTKHPERIRVKLRDEASLRGGKCSGQYKRILILPGKTINFSSDALKCLS
jgi:hypothetical protein